MKKKLLSLLLFIVTSYSIGQTHSGSITGIIKDQISQKVIPGVNIALKGTEIGTSTDDEGSFVLENLAFGRYTLTITHIGYGSLEKDVLVNSPSPITVYINLTRQTIELDELVVTEDVFLTELSYGTGKSVNMEQTNRIPANFFDPVRMMTSFPGVIAANDQANNLIIRGNSPSTMQWKLEGMDILNPNHTANAGTLGDLPTQNGGGVNIMSAQLLERTDLIQGPAPARMGNGLNAMNMSFRNGANENRNTIKVSLIGIDLATEGRIGKGNYLANYRYSTVGILTGPLGLDFGGEKITFQDISFHYTKNTQNGGLQVFGFGGTSKNEFDNTEEIDEAKDWNIINYSGKTGGVGFLFTTPSGWSIGSTLSATDQFRESIGKEGTPRFGSDTFFDKLSILSSSRVNKKHILNENHQLNYGGNMNFRSAEMLFDLPYTISPQELLTLSSFSIQPYLSLKSLFSNRIIMDVGFRAFTDSYTNSWIPEPRISLDWFLNENSLLRFAAGTHAIPLTDESILSFPYNEPIKPWKTHSFTLDYERKLNETWKVTTTGFMYLGRDIPVAEEGLPQTKFSLFNALDELVSVNLENGGDSRNYGWEVFVERRMANQFYLLLGGSLYSSEFTNLQGDRFQSRFDGRYTLNATGGYEKFILGDKNKVINASLRIISLGGLRERPVDEVLSGFAGYTFYDLTSGYTNQLDAYFRVDASVSYTKIKEKSQSVWSLDLQNVSSQENQAYSYWDDFNQLVAIKNQLGLIPVISYQIIF